MCFVLIRHSSGHHIVCSHFSSFVPSIICVTNASRRAETMKYKIKGWIICTRVENVVLWCLFSADFMFVTESFGRLWTKKKFSVKLGRISLCLADFTVCKEWCDPVIAFVHHQVLCVHFVCVNAAAVASTEQKVFLLNSRRENGKIYLSCNVCHCSMDVVKTLNSAEGDLEFWPGLVRLLCSELVLGFDRWESDQRGPLRSVFSDTLYTANSVRVNVCAS